MGSFSLCAKVARYLVEQLSSPIWNLYSFQNGMRAVRDGSNGIIGISVPKNAIGVLGPNATC